MRRFLDGLYWSGGVLGCVFMVGIAATIMAQIVGRLAGFQVPSADDISGYFMGASTFFALAYALRRGGHIRVELMLQQLGPGIRRVFEVWCLGAATAMSAYAAWWCCFLTWESYTEKKLVRKGPMAHVKIFLKDMAHLLGLARV